MFGQRNHADVLKESMDGFSESSNSNTYKRFLFGQ